MPIPGSGFVMAIKRLRTDRRGSGSGARYRTVGTYECYMDGVLLGDALLSGAIAEPRGPGDNSQTGVIYGRRIAAGTYQFGTHSGPRYATFNYDANGKKPALYVHDTDERDAILVHPGSGFKSTIGCINPTGSLTDADDDISASVSRTRVIALIDMMKASLGSRFPTSGVRRIADAWLYVEGEPD